MEEFGLCPWAEEDVKEVRHLHSHGLVIKGGTDRVLHPAVGEDEPQGGKVRGDGHKPDRGQVDLLAHALPAERPHRKEGGLKEEGGRGFDGQQRAEEEDVIIELKQAYNTVNIYSDILTGTMDAFASIISNNVNAIMKRMTSLSITLMIPTLIASFYGMNVDIHLEGFPYAFIFIILISVILSAGTFIWFRKIKWF